MNQNHRSDIRGRCEGKVIVHFKSEFDASLLNRFIADKGIYLNHLVFKKMSLEEQFLELTNK